MDYLISQPLVQLSIALLTGFAFGWLFRWLFGAKRDRAFVRDWGSRVRVAEHTRDKYEQEANEASKELAQIKAKHEKSSNLLGEIEAELKERDANISMLEYELSSWRERGPELESLVKERGAAIARLEHETEEFRRSAERRQASQESGDLSVTALEMQLENWETRLPQLENSLRDRDTKISVLEQEIASWRRAHAGLERQLSEHSAQLSNLEQVVGEWQAKTVKAETGDREQTITMLATELDEWKRKHAVLERELRRKSAPPAASGRQPTVLVGAEGIDKDNLKKIRGIGPVLEGTLNDLGIYRFQQIAELSEEEIANLAEKLRTFPDRIRRDRWVDQARELQSAKLGSGKSISLDADSP